MSRFCFYIFVFSRFLFFANASEYKVCATAEHDSLCKWIEASGKEVVCARVSDTVDCLLKMQKGEADFGTFYAEEAFLAARFLGNAGVVLAEVRHPERADRPFGFETVAVVRRPLLGGLSALRGLRYCHPGFSKAQYWSDRVLKDFERRVLEHFKDDVKCDSSTRSAYEDDLYRLSKIFGKACRPGTWAVGEWWDRKLKREYHNLCDQCDDPRTCSYAVQNGGRHSDALACLAVHGGNVAYTALEFVKEYFDLDSHEDPLAPGPEHKQSSRYDFLCPDGTTRPLRTDEPCSWIKQPWTSVVALNSTSVGLLTHLVEELEGRDGERTNHLRDILAKGKGVLKFRSRPVPVADYINEGRNIPDPGADSCRNAVKWCTVGKTEKRKCEYLSTAALTHGLPARLRCVEGNSKIDCLAKIRARDADVVYVDAELGFISRRVYNLTAAAYLETQRTGNYYGVLVVKGDAVKRFQDLRGKRACFPRYNGLGWLTYVEALKAFSMVPARSCSNSKPAWNHFSKACAPGAKDPALNPWAKATPDRLCKGCDNADAGSSCEATSTNPYYGEAGALRCLQNGDGDVAFLDFHAARRHLASIRGSSPDSNAKQEDFKILCRNGTLEKFDAANPEKCSFTQITGGEVVTRNDLKDVEKEDVSHTLVELDDLFGTTSRSYDPALKMFGPFDGDADALFKGSAVSLVSIYQTQNRFVKNYVKLLADLENCVDDSGSSVLLPSIFVVGLSIFLIFFQR